MAFNLFPYSNLHKLNLDWVIKQIKDAMTALEAASQTVTSYESRLSTVESSVQALTTATGNLQTAVNSHTTQIQANTTAINTLSPQVTQAVSDSSTALTAVNSHSTQIQANTTAINALSPQVTQAVSDSSTALTAATAASTATIRLQSEKLDKQGADALEVLGVTGNPDSATYPFYIKRTGSDPADYEIVEATPTSRGILTLHSESKSGAGVSTGPVLLRGVAAPLQAQDVANKVYVDGYNSVVVGASANITPVDNTVYHCGELTQLEITEPPHSGAYTIIFTSGATPTTTIIPFTILGLETFVADANTIYEINVWDDRAVVGSWGVAVE